LTSKNFGRSNFGHKIVRTFFSDFGQTSDKSTIKNSFRTYFF